MATIDTTGRIGIDKRTGAVHRCHVACYPCCEGVNHPPAVLERARRPGRSMGSLARALEGFFVERGLALPTDQAERLAAGRRQRRIDGTPARVRPAVQAFATEMLQRRRRARAAATRPRSDHTIEMTLTAVRDLAVFLHVHRGKSDWALVDVHDVEAFVIALPKTRTHRIVLVDPTRGLSRNAPRGFTGATLSRSRVGPLQAGTPGPNQAVTLTGPSKPSGAQSISTQTEPATRPRWSPARPGWPPSTTWPPHLPHH